MVDITSLKARLARLRLGSEFEDKHPELRDPASDDLDRKRGKKKKQKKAAEEDVPLIRTQDDLDSASDETLKELGLKWKKKSHSPSLACGFSFSRGLTKWINSEKF